MVLHNVFIIRAYLVDFMTQIGKKIRRNKSHVTAKHPKKTLAASSFSEYLKTFAASMKTSLASCRARTIEPTRKNLQLNYSLEHFRRAFSLTIISNIALNLFKQIKGHKIYASWGSFILVSQVKCFSTTYVKKLQSLIEPLILNFQE